MPRRKTPAVLVVGVKGIRNTHSAGETPRADKTVVVERGLWCITKTVFEETDPLVSDLASFCPRRRLFEMN